MSPLHRPMPYCVDTSGWLDGWQRHYPKDVFPSLWTKLDELIINGEVIVRCITFLQMIRELGLSF